MGYGANVDPDDSDDSDPVAGEQPRERPGRMDELGNAWERVTPDEIGTWMLFVQWGGRLSWPLHRHVDRRT